MKTFLYLVLTVAIVAGAVAVLKPDLRDRAVTAASEWLESLRNSEKDPGSTSVEPAAEPEPRLADHPVPPPGADAKAIAFAAFVRFQEAKNLHEAGHDALASEGFALARQLYERLEQEYPDFQPDVVQFRLGNIAEFQHQLAGNLPAAE